MRVVIPNRVSGEESVVDFAGELGDDGTVDGCFG